MIIVIMAYKKKKRFINDKKISIIGEFSYNLACKNYIAFDTVTFKDIQMACTCMN